MRPAGGDRIVQKSASAVPVTALTPTDVRPVQTVDSPEVIVMWMWTNAPLGRTYVRVTATATIPTVLTTVSAGFGMKRYRTLANVSLRLFYG